MRSCILAIFLSFSPETASAADAVAGKSVVFWELKSLGVDEDIATGVSRVLAAEIGRVEGFELIPDERIRQALSGHEELLGCQGELGCLVQLGEATSADSVIYGVLGILGDVFSLDMKLVDVASGMEIRRVAQTWSGETDSLIEVMRQVATRLLRPEAYRGHIDLRVDRSGVTIFVDGQDMGRTPLKEPLRLTPGRHALKLEAPGYKDFEKFVDVPFGRTVPLTVALQDLAMQGIVMVDRPGDFFNLGIKGGLVSNTGDVCAPDISLEFGVRLPLLQGHLAVLFETGVWGWLETRSASSEVLGDLSVDARWLVWSIQLNAIVRLLPDYPFSPYLTAGPGFFLVWQSLQPDGLKNLGYRDNAFGFQAGAGLEYRLGPGAVVLEARYLHVWIREAAKNGGVDGLLGGLGVTAGYRFML